MRVDSLIPRNSEIFSINKALKILSLFFILWLGNFGLEIYYKSIEPDHPRKIQYVQNLLVEDPELGFIWKENLQMVIKPEDHWMDIAQEGITEEIFHTDPNGFSNHPQAIESVQHHPQHILGIGDSFVQNASHFLYDYFRKEDLNFYSLSVHRYGPQQYNDVIKRHALAMKPELIVYVLGESDFEESVKFENWRQSGIPWFEFHSGLWSGDPETNYNRISPLRRVMKKHLNGFDQFLQGYLKLTGWSANKSPYELDWKQNESGYNLVLHSINAAHRLCSKSGIRFMVMLIPGKNYILDEKPDFSYVPEYYSRLSNYLNSMGIPVIDLRQSLRKYNPLKDLYWKSDNHLSFTGMEFMAREIKAVYQQ